MYKKQPKGILKHIDFFCLDLLMLHLAFILSYTIRHGFMNPYAKILYLNVSIVMTVGYVLTVIFSTNLKDIIRRDSISEFPKVLWTVSITMGIILLYFFVTKRNSFSRLTFFYLFFSALCLVYTERVLWRRFLQSSFGTGIGRKMVLITSKETARKQINKIKDHSIENICLSGVVLIDDNGMVGQKIEEVPILTTFKDFIPYIQTQYIDEVMFCIPREFEISQDVINDCLIMGITSHLNLDRLQNPDAKCTVEKLAGSFVLTETLRFTTQYESFVKRLMYIIGSIIGLFFTGILTVIVGPMIWLCDPGPIFFTQYRIGLNGKKFKIYKFRSMYMDAKEKKKELMSQNTIEGNMFKMEHDPRIIGSGKDGTKHGIGWFIRKTSLDEFPQFLNVLKGEMSLVGTRPPLVDEWENYDLHHRARMSIKPGLTGLWQVSGRSDITDFEEVIALDMEYINNWSVKEDIKIILKTIKIIFSNEGAK